MLLFYVDALCSAVLVAKTFAVHPDEAKVDHEIKIGCTTLTISHFPQMGLGRQGGGNTQISVAVSRLMQEKTSVATGGHGQAAAAWRTRGTPCLSGAWRTQMRRRAPSTRLEPFSHSRYTKTLKY